MANPHGARPDWPLAALTKLETVNGSPGAVTLSVAEAVSVPYVATIVTGPATLPAVTLTDTWPEELVVAEVVLIEADPLAREKFTTRPETGLLLVSFTWKTSGDAKAWVSSTL